MVKNERLIRTTANDAADAVGISVLAEKHWYIGIIKHGNEKICGKMLTELGIENYLPMQHVLKQYASGRKKWVDRIVLPSKIFVRVTENERMKNVVTLPCINRFMVDPLRREKKDGHAVAAIIPDKEMTMFRRMLDTKVRYRQDLENYITIPILGEIPSKNKKDDRKIVIDSNNRNAISEAFRILRSNIEYTRNSDGSATSYLFLSLVESSGKTFLTTNIAASLALVDKRVVLLDLDLRKGTLSRKFGMRKHEGFSDYLSGKLDDIEKIIMHDVVAEGVDSIPAGPIPPNPAELLASKRIETVFAYLREHYDYIIVDAVPVGIVADATIIKRFADVSVFVVRAGVVDKRMLPDIQKMKDNDEYPNMMILMNDVNIKKKSGKYGSYGYGYGDDDDNGKKRRKRHGSSSSKHRSRHAVETSESSENN